MQSAIGLTLGASGRAVLADGAGRTDVDERPAAVGLTDAGEVVVGDGAMTLDDKRRALGFVEQLGRPDPFIVAGTPYGAEALVAQLMRALVDGLTASAGAVDAIALAYADDLDPYRLDLLVEAARLAAVGDIAFVPEATARSYASDVAHGAALWALDHARVTPAGAPPATGSPVTARTALIGAGVAAGGVGAASVGGGAAQVAAGSASAFGAGASMADFGPSMADFAGRRRSMRGFAVAGVVAAVIIGGAAAVFATRGGGDEGDRADVTASDEGAAASEPDLDDPVAVAAAIDGSFELTTTVVDGNPQFAVGETKTFTLGVTASCTNGSCEVDIESVGSAPLAAGGEIRFAGPVTEPCTKDPSITVTGAYTIVLRVTEFDDAGNVSRLEGTNDQTVTDLAGCPDTQIDPISFEWVMERA